MSSKGQKSILVIGATGPLGQACIQKLADHSSQPSIHAFCRGATKVDTRCKSVVVGDGRNSQDLARALRETNADWVVVTIGSGPDLSKGNDIRTSSAKALAGVLQTDPAFSRVRTLLVSSNGAGTSKIVIGMGIGAFISFHLRHVLDDHTGQEAAFMPLKSRTIVVRPTELTNNAATGKLVEFGDTVKAPSIKCDRADLAEWIADAIASEKNPCVVNLTGVKTSS
jgi:NAD(P)-dependent dehydrogenase (short-subunit alcohol dehydrogenase family)